MLLAARVGHGTWVKEASAGSANEWVIRKEEGHRIKLWQNLPVQLDRAAIIRPLLGEVANGDLNALLGYDQEAGRPDQRQHFADWLAEQGVTCSEDRLLFSHGAQHGIILALLATGCVGETILCEGLSYPGMLGNARQLNNQVVGLAMDEEGLLPEPWRSQQFAAADALDVGVASGEHFAAGQFAAPQGVRLSLSQPATDARVGEGLARLAQLLQGTPPSNPLL